MPNLYPYRLSTYTGVSVFIMFIVDTLAYAIMIRYSVTPSLVKIKCH